MSVDLPVWFNPAAVTPEMEALRPLLAEDTVFVANTIRTLRLKLEAISKHLSESAEITDHMPDEARDVIDDLLGTGDLYGLLAYLPLALDIVGNIPGSAEPAPESEATIARILGET